MSGSPNHFFAVHFTLSIAAIMGLGRKEALGVDRGVVRHVILQLVYLLKY